MKKTNIFLLITGMSVSFSCTDFLTEDPKGRTATASFFTTKNDLDLALNALYQNIASATSSNNQTGTNFLAGDDISTHPASNKQPLREHDQYNVAENNTWLSSLWQWRWTVIKNANFIINNAGRTPEVTSEAIKSAIARTRTTTTSAMRYNSLLLLLCSYNLIF